jgi:flagellar hook assembly protein FlgD
VKVYDVRGTLVRTLSREVKTPGFYPIVWDGRNQGGQTVASGLYFVRMNSGTFQRTVRVTLMR